MKTILLIGNFHTRKIGIQSVSEELAQKLMEINYDVITPSGSRNRIFRVINLLLTTVKYSNNYSAAHIAVYSGPAFRWAEIIACYLLMIKKPFILTLHGGGLPEFARKHPARVRKLLTSANVVTSPSKYLITAFSPIRPDIRYLPNGIELADYPFHMRENPSPTLIWLRAFHKIYCPSIPILVLHEIRKSYPNARLTMIGPDKGDGTFQQAQALVKELGLQDAVTFTGAIPKKEVGKYLSMGDIFLNTTTLESFGVSTLEAAACGLCIVTTDVGELPLLWGNDHDALLVPPNDAAAMAEAVKRILRDPELAQRLSANARKKAEQYDWSVILPQWEKLFAEVTASSS